MPLNFTTVNSLGHLGFFFDSFLLSQSRRTRRKLDRWLFSPHQWVQRPLKLAFCESHGKQEPARKPTFHTVYFLSISDLLTWTSPPLPTRGLGIGNRVWEGSQMWEPASLKGHQPQRNKREVFWKKPHCMSLISHFVFWSPEVLPPLVAGTMGACNKC